MHKSPADNPRPTDHFSIDRLDYDLPPELIAQEPPKRRDDARMLVLERASGTILDRAIVDLPEFLRPGDLLVVNDTRVLPARFTARRATGGRVDGLFVREEAAGRWQVMLEGSRRLRPGEILDVLDMNRGSPKGLKTASQVRPFQMTLQARCGDGMWQVQVPREPSAEELLQCAGRTPLPPYIQREAGQDVRDLADVDRYQTVYARKPGAVAAPTAGLHLTNELLDHIRRRSVDMATVTLHVGPGTFRPITSKNLTDHDMHSEVYEVPVDSLRAVRTCRSQRGRILAIGTTTVRVLETIAARGMVLSDQSVNATRPTRQAIANGNLLSSDSQHSDPASRIAGGPLDGLKDSLELEGPLLGSTCIFVYPPYEFAATDMLLTNFHLPRSTLLALVMAFAGVESTQSAYAHAIRERYRFYSYGDAMLIY